MPQPVMVQGTVIQGNIVSGYNQMGNSGGERNGNQYNQQQQQYGNVQPFTAQAGNGSNVKGERQGPAFRDVCWAILFVVHLIFVLGFAGVFGPAAITAANNGGAGVGSYSSGFGAVIYNCLLSAMSAFVISAFSLFYAIKCARSVVASGLIFQCIMSFILMLITFASGNILMGVFGLVMFGVSIWYTYAVWNRIPFASANLVTATTAVKSNSGLFGLAYCFLAVSLIWTVCWGVTATGTYMVTSNCDNDGNCENSNGVYVFLLFLSYYWTQEVLKNVIHVTVAGTIGTWWFDPYQASSCCSKAVRDSFGRASSYSFGSICFGSLVVAIIRALRLMVEMMRGDDDNILVCILDCLLGCIESIVEYFNKWAYVYVGLYGYSFLEAGKNVLTLFESRGWTTIITDDLVEKALFLMNFGVGVLTGIIGFIVQKVSQDMYGVFGENNGLAGFIMGFVIGMALSSIVMSTIESAVNTVIVCYAESPAEFQANHPILSNEMREAWLKAYPEEYH
mmetsp:Transcript_1973/g.4265  ORF Transcript_1973/g.4265 Transcript_1973/m.4265 type:complete len:507 (-) Transcript_1973:555-2075(-)